MSLTEQTDQVEQALRLLALQYKSKEKLEAYLSSFITQVQLLEAAFFDIYSLLDIDTQTGAQLDLIGRIVQRAREGRSDAEYRPWLKAQIAANLSAGRADDLLNILNILGTTQGVWTTLPPAGFLIDLGLDTAENVTQIAGLIRQARGAGINGQLLYDTVAVGEEFRWADALAIQASEQGFSDLLTNLLTWSEALDDSDWTKVSATITANNATAPDGTETADTLVSAAGTWDGVYQDTGTLNAADHVQSIHAAPRMVDWIEFFIQQPAGGGVTARGYFDLVNGVVGTTNGGAFVDAGVVEDEEGYYRPWLRFTGGAATARINVRAAEADGDDTYSGGAGDPLLDLWGAQLVEGTEVGDYVKSEASPGSGPSNGGVLSGVIAA